MRQWLGRAWGVAGWVKMPRASKRDAIDDVWRSQDGREDMVAVVAVAFWGLVEGRRRMLEAVSGAGCTWRRRWVRFVQRDVGEVI